jgi:malate dehydrogenase (oxaloacetate-decarboxylating)(NADP+)
VRAKTINTAMKVAAAEALAAMAREPVPADVQTIYSSEKLEFGNAYIIPKTFDKRLFVEISFAVAKAAVSSGAASPGTDLSALRASLIARNKTRITDK